MFAPLDRSPIRTSASNPEEIEVTGDEEDSAFLLFVHDADAGRRTIQTRQRIHCFSMRSGDQMPVDIHSHLDTGMPELLLDGEALARLRPPPVIPVLGSDHVFSHGFNNLP